MSADRPFHRSAAARGERPMDSRTVDAAQAEAAVRRAMIEGGTCSVEVGDRRRVLVHEPRRDAPLKAWPWPISLLSPHRVRFITYEGPLQAGTITYEKSKIENAIRYFLDGLPAKAKVIITRDRGVGG